jgi:hypothetical protein
MSPNKGPTWTPKTADYRQVFAEQNPWHFDEEVPEAWAHKVERPLARLLAGRLAKDEPRRFQLILGPRRVGKSTVMYQTVRRLLASGVPAKQLWWLRLDHPLLMEIPLNALAASVREASRATTEAPAYLFLDELAYANQWDLWLKTFYDDRWPLRIVATSSSTAVLRDRRLESGVGRWEEQYLSPYLFPEYLDLVDAAVSLPVSTTLAQTLGECIEADVSVAGLGDSRRRFLLTGGFPELLLETKDTKLDDASALLQSQRILRSDAVERAVYKDIPQAFGVANPMLLERLLYTTAGQLAGLLSPTNLAQTLAGFSPATLERYLAYLERAFIVFTLPNYSGSEASKQRRGRKLYFVDGAVRNAALQRGVMPLSDQVEMGLLAENLVAGHLFALGQQAQVRLYHWRDGPDEVDLVYDHPERPLAFEVGLSASHSRGGLRHFMQRFPRFRDGCYLVSPEVPARSPADSLDRVGTLPIDLLLLAAGHQAARELKRRLVV